MNQQYFAVKVRTLRKEMGLTQEQLADKMGMSVQAVSKWECADSYPDIGTLVRLADLFGVSIDALLREGESPKIYNEDPIVAELPKDDKLRIVQVYNGHVLSQDEYDPEIKIPLVFPDVNLTNGKSNVPCTMSVEVRGSIYGDVNAGNSVTCDDVNGSVTILGTNGNGTVTCGNIAGPANVNFGSLTCDDINGSLILKGKNETTRVTCSNIISAASVINAHLTCDDIHGNLTLEGMNEVAGVTCSDIMSDVSVINAHLTCDDIRGDLTLEGHDSSAKVVCNNISGDADIDRASLTCDSVDGEVRANDSDVNIGD